MNQVATWRAQLGAGARLWSSGGRHVVEDGRWLALSGAKSPEFNVILCSGGDPELIARSLVDVAEGGAPSVIMLTGEALGSAQALPDAGWVCVGATPFMRLAVSEAEPGVTDSSVRRLGTRELSAAQDLLADATSLPASFGVLALPDLVVESDAMSLWGIDSDESLAAVLAVSTVDDSASIWSMATDPRRRRQGYGRRLLRVVLAEAALSGTTHVLLTSSPMGESLYRSMGFTTVEHWQQWSRPRWVLGRS